MTNTSDIGLYMRQRVERLRRAHMEEEYRRRSAHAHLVRTITQRRRQLAAVITTQPRRTKSLRRRLADRVRTCVVDHDDRVCMVDPAVRLSVAAICTLLPR